MHSLKPSGDNIAQEFLKLIGQKSLVKSANLSLDLVENTDPIEAELDKVYADNKDKDVEKVALNWAEQMEDAVLESPAADDEVDDEFAADSESFAIDDADDGLDFADDNLEDMIMDENLDQLSPGVSDIDKALDSFQHTASEKQVLFGLSKNAGSLRTKGESFAADVVEATALSIKGDLQKDAKRRATVVSELKKLASEFYKGNDPLAGDMVQVTINKLGGFKQPEKPIELDPGTPVGTGVSEEDEKLTIEYWLEECSKKLSKPRGTIGVQRCAKAHLNKTKKEKSNS